jgi:TonB-linked SusC/RagA family outer membrane protein
MPSRKNHGWLSRITVHLSLLFISLLCSFIVSAQQNQTTGKGSTEMRTITGKVSSGDSSIPGATVTVKGRQIATQTDADGRFSIQAPGNATLVITYVGYGTVEVKPGSRSFVYVPITPAVEQVNEVVVVGYGTQRKATLTGSVSQVSGSEIAISPSPNVGASLAGKLPGLIVNQNTGEPGHDDPSIYIRGISTVPTSAYPGGPIINTGPLIIIDGVERNNLTRLDPADIQSFSVLKDASAAIYGARAANGVILVTTKRGQKGKTVFDFNYNYGIQNVTKIPKMLDAATFATVYDEGDLYRQTALGQPYNPQTYIPTFTPAQIQKYKDGSDPVNYPNTDWVKAVLKSSYVQKVGVQASGGSETSRYLLSFSATTQDGDFKHVPDLYKQYNARIKLETDVAKNLTIGANISGIISDGHYSSETGDPSGGTAVNFVNILQANPTITAIYPNGDIGPGRLQQNPLLLDQEGFNNVSVGSLYSTFTASYKAPFVPGLKIDASYNYDLANTFTKQWRIPYYFYQYNVNTKNYDHLLSNAVGSASLQDTYSKSTTTLSNFKIYYERTFMNKHHVSALVGVEQQYNTNSFADAYRKNFVSTALPQINVGSTAPADQGTGGSESAGAYNNYFGRVDYDFESKYLVEFLFRDNGSQIFAQGKRYGFFPGVSGGWVLSEEKFMKDNVPFVNFLKVRATYGELGNDRIGQYQYLQSYSFANNYVFGTGDVPGISPNLVPNPNVTWEVSKKTDFGLEATLWKGLLGIDFTLFQEHRTNILVPPSFSVSNVYGFPGLPDENFGKVDNHGFELVLTHRQNFGDFSYSISGNISFAKSKIINMDETPHPEPWQDQTGHPVGSALYYKSVGIFRDQADLTKNANEATNAAKVGDQKFANLSGGKQITANDQFIFDESSLPEQVFGLTTNFRYKAFDLDLFFQGQSKVYNEDAAFSVLGGTDFANGMVARAANRWTLTNPNGTMPRADASNPGPSTLFLYDATFVRLKTAQIGFSLPKGVLSRTRVFSDVRFYVSGFNLLTWAKAIKYADPEMTGTSANYPPQRIINFGVDVKF